MLDGNSCGNDDDDGSSDGGNNCDVFRLFQEAEEARKKLCELQAITAAVESSGQTKAEAHVSIKAVIRYCHVSKILEKPGRERKRDGRGVSKMSP